jgi:ribosomal protein L27
MDVGRLAKNALLTGQILVNGRNTKLAYGSAVSYGHLYN